MERALEGQTAIVTGGARGIGLGIARRLADDGCRVALWDLDVASFDAAAAGFAPAHLQAVNVADLAAVERAAAATEKALGKVDILVNNAGINGPVAPTWEYPPEAWDKVLAVDLTGVFYCCRAVVPGMRTRGYGRIVNVASIVGKEGSPGIAAYAAAKAGVIGFTKSLARELVDSGVLVNAIAPVITETDLFRGNDGGAHRHRPRQDPDEPLSADSRDRGHGGLDRQSRMQLHDRVRLRSFRRARNLLRP